MSNKPFVQARLGHFAQLSALVNMKKPVHVYKNLHKQCWSVRQGGIVKAHTDYVCLRNCEFKVQPAGHAKVIKEKRKNVHAYVKGFLCNPRETYVGKLPFAWDDVKYNPYEADSFLCDGEPCKYAKYVDMCTVIDHGQVLGSCVV